MRKTFIIAFKDYKTFFTGPTAYVVGALFLFIVSQLYLPILFTFAERSLMMMMGQGQNMSLNQWVFPPMLGNIMVLLVFSVPPIMMKLMSDEYRNRTMDLLMTSPITATQIVMGKFLAGVLFLWTLLLGVSANFWVTGLVTKFDKGPVLVGFLGLMLISAVFAAVCLFASSLTENPIIAAFIGWVLCLFVWIINFAANMFEDSKWQTLFNNLSVRTHFDEFAKGVITSQGVVYFLSLTFLFCFLSHRVIESARWR